MSPEPASILVEVVAEHVLTERECFPDGAPEGWDARTILAAIQKDGLAAWALDAYGFSVRVSVSQPNPHYVQAESLLPDHAPDRNWYSEARGTAR